VKISKGNSFMQIAININDTTVASKILDYLKSFKQGQVQIETSEDLAFDSYLKSKEYQQDRKSLHQTLSQLNSNENLLSEVDAKFWSDMDKAIESA